MTQHTSHEVCDREPKGFKIKNEILSRRRWHISGRNPPEDEGLGNRQGRVSGRLRIEFVSGLLNVHASSGGRSSCPKNTDVVRINLHSNQNLY